MAYYEKIYRFKNSIEHEIKFLGKYGAAGEKRSARKRATPEQIKHQNQRNKETRAKRVMKLNFEEGDLWCTLLYRKGTRKAYKEVRKDLNRFLRNTRGVYQRRGQELRYMIRIEIGKRGGIHIHMICNRLRGAPEGIQLIQDRWEHGRVHFESFAGKEEDYERLASYLVKAMEEEHEKRISEREDADEARKGIVRYSTSKNLKRPEPEKKHYRRRTLRKMLEEGIQPTPGYCIYKPSIRKGVNPYTGTSYLYYTEIKAGKLKGRGGG